MLQLETSNRMKMMGSQILKRGMVWMDMPMSRNKVTLSDLSLSLILPS